MSEFGIETIDLTKAYGDHVVVDRLNLKIPRGHLFGFLGPNGAGKSTTINMLSTILSPTAGSAKIHGLDLQQDRTKVREIIGVCPQELVLYDKLSAKENLHLIAQMHNLHPLDYKERTDDLLGRMQLLDRANDRVETYSGGMKRRINVLMAVIHDPEVIFFDEPSAGLDPQSRRVVWDFIKDFEREQKTVILTTHNMEEADDLSEELVIIDHGKIIAQGSPQSLKSKIGVGDVIEFRIQEEMLPKRNDIIEQLGGNKDILWAKPLGKELISFSALNGLRKISAFYEYLEEKCGVIMRDVQIRQNSLEDVFLELTGRQLRE
jgi:ABC-2 type transport system ATP-binding protein